MGIAYRVFDWLAINQSEFSCQTIGWIGVGESKNVTLPSFLTISQIQDMVDVFRWKDADALAELLFPYMIWEQSNGPKSTPSVFHLLDALNLYSGDY